MKTRSGVGDAKAGYVKLEFCAEQAEKDNLQYMWVDTCCIDKTSSAELQESSTSMYRCCRLRQQRPVPTGWEAAFRANDWFTRGWTLQELVPAATPRSGFAGPNDGSRAAGRKSAVCPDCDDEKADIKQLVQDYLSRKETGRWILVFDNCDNADMWTDKSTPDSRRLLDCLPKSTLGSIIFTTRDRKLANRLAGRNTVDLQDVGDEGGTALLRNYLYDQTLLDNEQDAAALLQWLAYLPLAIVQAAMYINENTSTLGDYLLLLEEQEEDVVELLSKSLKTKGGIPTTASRARLQRHG